jgi:A-factor biosynthesis hotdog domain
MTVATRAAEQLSFEQTVPCSLAHRRARGEVFVADSLEVSEDEFLLAVQVPRAHSLWFDRRAAYHDPFSTAEAARQGAFVVVHRHLGVPRELPFSLQRFKIHVEDLAAYRDNRRSPLEGMLRFRLAEKDMRGPDLGSLTFEGDLTLGESVAMTLSGSIVFVPKSDYEALREYQRARKPLASHGGAAGAKPLAPGLVGRLDRRNVVIGQPASAGDEDRYPLVVDRSHPSFFDHDYDHLPGPLIVESYRQAAIVTAVRARAVPSPVVAATACETAFSDFAEFEAGLECSASVRAVRDDGQVAVTVGAHQLGKQIATGEIELNPYPEEGP